MVLASASNNDIWYTVVVENASGPEQTKFRRLRYCFKLKLATRCWLSLFHPQRNGAMPCAGVADAPAHRHGHGSTAWRDSGTDKLCHIKGRPRSKQHCKRLHCFRSQLPAWHAAKSDA